MGEVENDDASSSSMTSKLLDKNSVSDESKINEEPGEDLEHLHTQVPHENLDVRQSDEYEKSRKRYKIAKKAFDETYDEVEYLEEKFTKNCLCCKLKSNTKELKAAHENLSRKKEEAEKALTELASQIEKISSLNE